MERLFYAVWFWLFLCVVCVAAAEPLHLTAGFSKTEIKPGELVEFEARLDAETAASFKLKLPESVLLLPITKEVGPLRLENGRFRQVQRWVFQAVASGNVTWESLVAQVVQADGAHAYALPAVALRIVPYAQADDSGRPQALPLPLSAQTRSAGLGLRWLLVGFAVLAVGGGIGWAWKRWRARR
jgi:uncharacterized membrane protein YcgQ (UPF0703/DUF1980 family)